MNLEILIAIVSLAIGSSIVIFILDIMGFFTYLYWLVSGGSYKVSYLEWLIKRQLEREE